jgi:hypothetical protein
MFRVQELVKRNIGADLDFFLKNFQQTVWQIDYYYDFDGNVEFQYSFSAKRLTSTEKFSSTFQCKH